VPDLQGAIREWLTGHLAGVFGMPPAQVSTSLSFERYGLDSAAVVGMTGELADWLGCDIDPTLAYDHPNVDALARALADDAAVRRAFAARNGTQDTAA
jgi:acyl carrier protein